MGFFHNNYPLIGFGVAFVVVTVVLITTWTSQTPSPERQSLLDECSAASANSGEDFETSLGLDTLMHKEPRCQETEFEPFRIGCPSSCVGYRPDASDDEIYYRTAITWWLGEPDFEGPTPQAFDRGVNLRCPVELQQGFRRARDAFVKFVDDDQPTDLLVKHQTAIHINLAYVCCLKQEEVYWVHQAFEDWILERYPFNIPLGTTSSFFNNLQCWRERDNSVTNILVLNNDSQFRLQCLYDDLMNFIIERSNGLLTFFKESFVDPKKFCFAIIC